MLLGTLLFLALLATLVWAVIHMVTGRTAPPVGSSPPAANPAPSALELLNQRYARGEIDAMTYEQMRARLETPRTQPPSGRV